MLTLLPFGACFVATEICANHDLAQNNTGDVGRQMRVARVLACVPGCLASAGVPASLGQAARKRLKNLSIAPLTSNVPTMIPPATALRR
jgi:hypothetical protein